MVVSVDFSTCFKRLQHGDLLRSPWTGPFVASSGCGCRCLLRCSGQWTWAQTLSFTRRGLHPRDPSHLAWQRKMICACTLLSFTRDEPNTSMLIRGRSTLAKIPEHCTNPQGIQRRSERKWSAPEPPAVSARKPRPRGRACSAPCCAA